jgi:hypothetical protein
VTPEDTQMVRIIETDELKETSSYRRSGSAKLTPRDLSPSSS